MTPTASGLDEARERLTTVETYQELGPDGYTDVAIVTLSDLRLLLASEAALREALKPFARVGAHRLKGVPSTWLLGILQGVTARHMAAGDLEGLSAGHFQEAARLSQDGGAESVARGEDG